MGRAFEYRRAAKEKRWASMSRVFPKIARQITMAAKEGGPDPDMNPRLRLAIQNAKAANMPKDNVKRAIERATGKDSANYTEVNYEGKGPHGILVFVESATDNTTRTIANVKSYFNKSGGSLSPNGALEFMFNRRAVFEIEREKNENLPEDLEELELELIDHGLEDIEADGDTIYLYSDYKEFGSMASALEKMSIVTTKADLQRFPTTPTEFSDEQMVDIEKFLDKLDEDDDVQAVYTNMA